MAIVIYGKQDETPACGAAGSVANEIENNPYQRQSTATGEKIPCSCATVFDPALRPKEARRSLAAGYASLFQENSGLIALLRHVIVINGLENIFMFGLFLGQNFKNLNKLGFVRRLCGQLVI